MNRRQFLQTISAGGAVLYVRPGRGEEIPVLPLYAGRRDFTYLWWAHGLEQRDKHVNIQTGHYGISFDAEKGTIRRLGCITDEYTNAQVLEQDNSIIEALPTINDMKYVLTVDGKRHVVDRVVPDEGNVAFRIIDSGTYIQRCDFMSMRHRDSAVRARLEFSALSEYLTYNYQVLSKEVLRNVILSTAMKLDSKFENIKFFYEKGRALGVSDESGRGYIFIVSAGTSIEFDKGEVRISRSGIALEADKWGGMGWTCIPTDSVMDERVKRHLALECVRVEAEHLEPTSGRADIRLDDLTNVYWISTPSSARHRNFSVEKNKNMYERIKFSIANPGSTEITVPVCFYKKDGDRGYSITGMSPMLRDAVTLEPTGQKVQISKNWHGKRGVLYAGPWFHGYTYIKVPAGGKVEYEFTMAYANWGKVFAASHSQLSLAGWKGGNQLWHTSGIGSFGESFCYDPDIGLGRAMIDDVRPLCVKNMYGTDQKYVWTNCVGGGDFLVCYDASRKRRRLVRMRTDYADYAPNLAHVTFAGVMDDGAVEARIDTYLPRTDDIAKAYHKFMYVFKKDVEYSRLAFYQFGAERYNDNLWEKCAWGDTSGLVKEIDIPLDKHDVGYRPDLERAMTVPGETFWVGMHRPHNCKRADGHYKNESGAPGNKALAVRKYHAVINGREYDRPSFSVYRTNNFNQPCVLIELSLPKDVGGTIKAGSVVEGTVEFLVLPRYKSDYYGSSEVLRAVYEEEFDKWNLAHRYAVKGEVKVKTRGCRLLSSYPVCIEGAGEFEITGGMGYVPVTISGLDDYRNWRLFEVRGQEEIMIDQSVRGNDYWQCRHDPYTGKYALTFNVEHNGGTKTYILKMG